MRNIVRGLKTAIILAVTDPVRLIQVLQSELLYRRYRVMCGSFGQNVTLWKGIKVYNADKLFIGNDVAITEDVWINAQNGVHIGNDTLIGPRTIIVTMNHIFDRLDIPIRRQGLEVKPIVIEDDVWIGAGCIILPGVRIGRGCVIGAGAVVAHDIPPYSVATGIPATVRRNRKDKLQTPNIACGRSGFRK